MFGEQFVCVMGIVCLFGIFVILESFLQGVRVVVLGYIVEGS